LLVVFVVCFLLAGYWMMKRLDLFLSQNLIGTDEAVSPVVDIALIANEELSRELGSMFRTGDISFDVLQGEDDFYDHEYRLICAFTQDDLQNLLFCTLGKKISKARSAFSRCNNPLHRNLFRDAGAQCLEEADLTLARIKRELTQITVNAEKYGDGGC